MRLLRKRREYPGFGDAGPFFENLYEWLVSIDLTLKESQTYLKSENKDLLPIYRYNVQRINSSEYLFAMWNEVGTTEGKFTSIPGNSQIGEKNLAINKIPPNNIPGFVTYFWVLPSQKKFASIQFSSRIRGTPTFQLYNLGFLEKFSKWVEIMDGDYRSLDVNIKGYTDGTNSYSPNQITPKFNYSLIRKRGEFDYIRANREKITKIIKKDTFKSTTPNDRNGLLNSMMAVIGLPTAPSTNSIDSHYKFEFEMKPSAEDLEAIISAWEGIEGTTWTDVGFKFKGESAPKWLKSAEVKGEFDLDVTWTEDHTTVELNSLGTSLTEKRADIMSILTERSD